MIRVLRSIDGTLREDPDLTSHAAPAVPASPRAAAAGASLHRFVEELAAENKAVLDSLTDPMLKRSLERGLRGR